MFTRKKNYLVVGLGRFGASLCERLVELKQRVVGVDIDKARVEDMADKLDIAAQLDSIDEEALIKVGAKDMDVAIVAIGEDVKSSVLSTAILRDLGIPYVVARAIDNLHAKVLSRVGAHKVLSPERETGLQTANHLVHPWLTKFSSVSDTDIVVGEINPTEEMLEKTLMELKFPQHYKAFVLTIERNGKRFMPKADTTIEKDDKLWITGETKDLAKWLNLEDY